MQLLLGASKVKFTYFLRTAPDIHDYIQPIEETIANKFISAILGGHIPNDVKQAMGF